MATARPCRPDDLSVSLVVIGVDPGSRYTGLVIRLGDQVVNHAVLDSGEKRKRALPPAAYMIDVTEWMLAAHAHVVGLGHEVVVAVEGLVPPSMFMGARGNKAPLTDPATHMGLSMVFGGVIRAFPAAVEVRPGAHGSNPLQTYPSELVGIREKGLFGSGILGHARSAWDVAGMAVRALRVPHLAWRTGDP